MLNARFIAGMAIAFLVACSGRGPSANFVPQPYTPGSMSSAGASDGVRFVVTLPLRDRDTLSRFLEAVGDPSSPEYHHFLTREQFAAQYAPREKDLHAVELELQRAGLTTQRDLLGISAGGSAARVQRYFAVPLQRVTWRLESGTSTQIAARGSLHLSPLLRSVGANVIGLENLPPMRKFSHFVEAPEAIAPHNNQGPYGPYLTPDLKQAYRWPAVTDVDGSGVTIAIAIDLPVKLSDVNYYAKAAGGKSFHVTQVAVDGGGQWDSQGSGEATLDVEQSAGMAPGANVVVYDVGSLAVQNIYDGYVAALKNKKVGIVNSSFGACEAAFTTGSGQSAFKAFDQLFAAGAAVGVTFVASSGDQAALGCPQNVFNRKGTGWPAIDPFVLSVGGTNLTTNTGNGNDSSYVRESEFYEPLGGGQFWGSGGGYSTVVVRPSWQKGFVTKSGRGVPDMSLHMGGEGFSGNGCSALRCNKNDSSDFLRIANKWYLAIGTSASSPDIVGLVALRAEKQRSLQGDIHKWLYANGKGSKMWRKGIKGNNGYKTTTGNWDPVLGLGTVVGNSFVGTKSVAGTPGSASNP